MQARTSIDPIEDRIYDEATMDRLDEAIFTCKYPGCTRQYASTDGVRKHCRKSHPEWLREVDLEKAANGCRWAAYCTREAISDGNDPRMTPVGSKRAREIMVAGGMLPPLVGGAKSNAERAQESGSQAAKDAASGSSALPSTEELLAEGDAALLKHTASRMISGGAINVNFAAAAERRQVSISVRKTEPSYMSIGTAMDGKSALRPPAERRKPVSAEGASRESMLPPEMVSVPTDLSAPLPTNTSSLTPNAQARQRLGEIADGESSLLLGHGSVCPTSLPSPLCDGVPAPPPGFGFFVQWSMPPLKRGRSLADTRDAEKGMGCSAPSDAIDSHPDDPQQVHYDSPSFLDSVLN